jgi:drug/metabolite transporter (DMT)-like permease
MTVQENKPIVYKLYLLLVALILVWGISWPIAKIGLSYMSPLWFAAFRLLIGTASMFLVVAVLGKLIWPNKQDLKIIFVIGLLQVGLFMLLITIGLVHVDAGRSSVLVYTTPLWVVPISVLFFKEKPTVGKWMGFILGLAGILILFNPLAINWSEHNEILGNGVLLLAAFCWAIAILCARYMHWSRSPLELISWQLLVGTIPVVLLAFLQHPEPQIVWNSTSIFVLLFCGILSTAFAYWGSVVISKELPAITTSLSLLAIPVCGLLFSAWLLHEKMTFSLILAMVFILGGLLCVMFDRLFLYKKAK